jgi:hypothetical protein
MKFAFTGDTASFARFVAKFDGTDRLIRKVNGQLAEATIDLIRDGFETHTAPDGAPWDPPLLRDGLPLEDTGGLKGSWFVVSSGPDGFQVANAKKYAEYAQDGTGLFGPKRHKILPITKHALKLPGGLFFRSVKGMKPRKMVPDDGSIPPRWADTYVEVADEVLSAHFNGP